MSTDAENRAVVRLQASLGGDNDDDGLSGSGAGSAGVTQMSRGGVELEAKHIPKTVEEVFEEEEDAIFESERHDVDDIDPSGISPLSTCLGVALFPFTLMCSWYTVREQEEVVVLNYGKYTGTTKDAGIHFSNCFGRELRRVTKQKKSIDLPTTKVVDFNGNPLLVSAIVVYSFVNTKRASIDMVAPDSYVANQARAVMRQVVSKFPYEHLRDGETGPTLKGESAAIGHRLVQLLQRKVAIAGAKVLSFQFDEISYAPEIAQGMLKRQQAMATVAARSTIVQGAVDIAHSAFQMIEARGTQIDPAERGRMMANLLIVIASESGVQPTMSVRA